MNINLGMDNHYYYIPNFNSIGSNGYGDAPWINDDCINSIINVFIEDGFTRIGNYTFDGCNNLISVSIPESVTDIGYAFWGCHNIATIVCHSIYPPNINNTNSNGDVMDVFRDVNKTECVLYVPAEYEEAYRIAKGWEDFVNIKAIQ